MNTRGTKSEPTPDASGGPAIRRGCRDPQNAYRPFEASEVEQSIVARFEAVVAEHPDAPAISDGIYRWSYRELNGLANRIASALLPDAMPNHISAVLLFEYGASAIAAMLGVLKAGDAAFRWTLGSRPRDSAGSSKITAPGSSLPTISTRRARWKSHDAPRRVISIDEFKDQRLVDNLGLSIAPGALACVLFTSRSTGMPKGVVHNHRSIMHAVMNYTHGARIDASDRRILLSSYDVGASS